MPKIVLIDDDPLVRETLAPALQLAGHSVEVLPNGSQIEAILSVSNPDIVITDILMPDTDGLETVRRIKRSKPSVKIIAISGGGRTRNLDLLGYAKSFGADAILPKPFLPRDLVDLISRVASST